MEKDIAGRLAVDIPYFITVPQGQDVLNGDRIAIGTRTFEVYAVLMPSWETARRCICAEVV